MKGINFSFILESNSPFTAKDFLDKIFGNFWSLLINLLALIVLFVFVFFIAYKPLRKYVDKRKEYIESNIKDAEDAKELYEGKLATSETMIEEAQEKASNIIAKAEDDAKIAGAKIIEKANEDAKLREMQAQENIRLEEEKARKALHDEVVNLAFDTSKELLGRSVESADNKRLADEFASSLEKKE